MAGKKRRRRRSDVFAPFAAKALDATLNVQANEILLAVVTAKQEGKSAEEMALIIRAKLLGCAKTWVDDKYFGDPAKVNKDVFKMVGVEFASAAVVAVDNGDDEVDDDEDEEDEDEE